MVAMRRIRRETRRVRRDRIVSLLGFVRLLRLLFFLDMRQMSWGTESVGALCVFIKLLMCQVVIERGAMRADK